MPKLVVHFVTFDLAIHSEGVHHFLLMLRSFGCLGFLMRWLVFAAAAAAAVVVVVAVVVVAAVVVVVVV